MWNEQYVPGITCGQVWCLLNGGNPVEILADTTLTQRAKRVILAQKYLTNRAALERIIRDAVGNDEYEEYYSDAAAESDDTSSDSSSEDQTDSEEEEPTVVRREKVSTPVRRPPTLRKLRIRDRAFESDDQYDSDIDPPAEVVELNQHLEALNLGTPGQRPKTPNSQKRPPRSVEVSSVGPKATLEELMKRDQEMKKLKKAKLKNTTVKGKVRELVR